MHYKPTKNNKLNPINNKSHNEKSAGQSSPMAHHITRVIVYWRRQTDSNYIYLSHNTNAL